MASRTSDLFPNELPTPPIARRRDPVTSKRAAITTDRGSRVSDKERLYTLIKACPGHTASEYGDLLMREGMPGQKAIRMPTRRVHDLIADGRVYAGEARTCEVTGHSARPYYPK